MTIATLALAVTLQDPQETPPQLVSRMIRRYYDAKTIGGTIRSELDVSGAKLTIDTTLWLERPSKLYLRQTTSAGPSFLVTADGKDFSYGKPAVGGQEGEGTGRLVEFQGANDLGFVYSTASLSVAERSTPLDLAISRGPDLKMLRDQWVTVTDGGTKDIDGVQCRVVTGKWTSNPAYGVLGHYAMWISPEGDLMQFEIQGPDPSKDGGKVSRKYKVDLKVGATPPDGQFTVAR